MVYCVAPNCSSDSTKVLKVDGVGYYNFPRDKKARKVWVRRMHRPSSWVPSLGARVCSKHFVAGDYLLDPAICRAIGFDPKKRLLKPGAFPTLFSHGEGDAMDGTPTTSAPRSAVQKRAHQQAVAEAVAGYNVLYGEEAEEAAEQDDGFLMADEGRFEEVGNHLIEDAVLPQSLDDLEVLPQEHPETFAIGTQVGSSVSMRFAKAVQVNIVTGSRNKGSQTTSCTGDIGCQAEPEVREIAIQTDLFDIDVPVFQGLKPSDEDMEDEEVHFPSQETMKTDDSDDEDWEPCEDDYCQEFDDSLLDDENVSGKHYDFDNEYEQPSPQYERKFIVFESSLRLLFMFCQVCRAPCRVALRTLGTAVMVMAICENQHQQEWTSQPFKGQLPIGNLLLAAGILYSGSSPVRGLNILKNIGVAVISRRTFYTIQGLYLIPSVFAVWQRKQDSMFKERKRKQLSLSGDARCCSPGHTAKYGSYSLMDESAGKVLDVSLVQSNEVKNSYWMELEGLKRSMALLVTEKKLAIAEMVTDRHSQIKKYLRDKWPGVQHWFDCWHIAKGVKKKMDNIAKKYKLCRILAKWSQSVSNHIFWCAASSNGNGDLVEAKWLSILNHVADVHDGHGDLYPKCLHGPLEDREWIKKGSKAHKELTLILTQKILLKDIRKVSPGVQTSSLESYHKIVGYFAPKSRHFFYEPMKARLLLATLHFNENSNRKQRIGQDEQPQWSISYPKGRGGAAVAKEVKIESTYDYVQLILEDLLKRRDDLPSYKLARDAKDKYQVTHPIPGPVCSKYDMDKMKVVEETKNEV
ncbi:uncharacterized protein LOC135497319 isoform X1 [Lineus longissimus]|uniref:uncharacterized protein LOC135497319 isoform X1 n=1 Tax=Lineus longissimus TaxID=88925 RepID=UPI00315CCC76